MLHVLGPVSSSMCSYQDITQLVLFLLAVPPCCNVIDKQKELDRRKKTESKEGHGREGSGGEMWRKKTPYSSGKQAEKKKEERKGRW